MASQDNKLAETVGVILFALVMFYIFVIKPIIDWIKLHYIKATLIILAIIGLLVWLTPKILRMIQEKQEKEKERKIREAKEAKIEIEKHAKEIKVKGEKRLKELEEI